MWTFSRAYLSSVVALALAGVNFSVGAADLSAQERLNAIRSAMVEAAMKSNTRVSATSWMDSDGALRELNRFSSEIKVRELQVRKYSRDDNQEPQADMVAAKVGNTDDILHVILAGGCASMGCATTHSVVHSAAPRRR